VLRVGVSARFFNAVIVSEGGVAPGGVVKLRKLPHAVPNVVPPGELMQAARISAIVFSCVVGIVVPVGTPVPGVAPVCVFAIIPANLKALANRGASTD
jgi:hypothetical protein